MYDIGINLGVKNIYDLVIKEIKGICKTRNPTKQQIRKYKRHASELFSGEKGKYIIVDIALKIIINSDVSTATNFRNELDLNSTM